METQSNPSFQDKFVRFIKIAQSNWGRAEVTQNAAEMAYFALLSLFPVLLVIANIIPLLPINEGEVMSYLSTALPGDVFNVIQPVLEGYLQGGSGGAISIGVITSIWSASKVITSLRNVLNDVYGVELEKNFLIARILSLAVMILILAAIGLVIFAFVFGEQILLFIENTLGFQIPFIQQFLTLRWVVIVIVFLLFFSLVYQFVPNHNLSFKYAIPGAIFATLGGIILSQGFSLYIGLAGGDAVANATFGAFIVLMLFLYLAGMIVLLGGLVNAVYYEWKTGQSVQEYTAELEKQQELEQEGTTAYPKEDTRLLRRELKKVNRLDEEEIEERMVDEDNK